MASEMRTDVLEYFSGLRKRMMRVMRANEPAS